MAHPGEAEDPVGGHFRGHVRVEEKFAVLGELAHLGHRTPADDDALVCKRLHVALAVGLQRARVGVVAHERRGVTHAVDRQAHTTRLVVDARV